MANVIDIEVYRFFKMIKGRLALDGIKCKFSYDDEVFIGLTNLLRQQKLSYPEFYTKIASHAMLLDSITVD